MAIDYSVTIEDSDNYRLFDVVGDNTKIMYLLFTVCNIKHVLLVLHDCVCGWNDFKKLKIGFQTSFVFPLKTTVVKLNRCHSDLVC